MSGELPRDEGISIKREIMHGMGSTNSDKGTTTEKNVWRISTRRGFLGRIGTHVWNGKYKDRHRDLHFYPPPIEQINFDQVRDRFAAVKA